MQDTWLKVRRRIKRSTDRRAWIAWTRGSTDHHQHTWLLIGSYKGSDFIARDASRSLDRDPMGAIKCVFKRLSTRLILALHLRSNGRDIFETVHDGLFHRNRQLKPSDGHAQTCINRDVLQTF